MPSVTAPGKSNVFFSTSHFDKEWRLQEQLVALFEANLQGKDTSITFSPKNVPDIIGSMENVDVVYAVAEDTSSYLSFVEVRDHSRKVNRQYIQEIMGKRKSIGIDDCAVASTKGFTKDAVRLAQHEGIKLRVLSSISPDATPFFTGSILPYSMRQRMLARCCLFFHINGEEKVRIVDGNELNRVSLLAPKDEADTYLSRPLSLLAQSECFTLPCFSPGDTMDSEVAFFAPIPHDGRVYRAAPIVITYDTPKWYDILDGELVPITRIHFCILASILKIEAPIHGRYKYVDDISKDVIARSVLARFYHNEVLYNLTLTAFDAEQTSEMQYLKSSLFFGEVQSKRSASKSAD